MRLNALEAIELIIKEKSNLEIKTASRRGLNRSFAEIGWRQCRSIYKYLSHHYILKKSVVFIVDSQFDSLFYKDSAMKHVMKCYENLADQDYFGLISLDVKN